LEALPDQGKHEQKSEYSLTQHLANNLIDMYINLPSKNRYRRPANYISKGYKTRRMAVDFAVPLITDVKCAKLLAEALVRKLPLDVSSVDSKSSHDTHIFPGFVNVAAYVPTLTTRSGDLAQATKASLGAGFTTALILPVGEKDGITNSSTLSQVQIGAAGVSHSNYALSVVATADNVGTFDEEVQADVKYLFIPFRSGSSISISAVASHFATWPKDKLIVTDAEGPDLSSILLLASLHGRSVHITGVQKKDDILLISLSKAKELQVTCDTSIYSLFFAREKFSGTSTLPTVDDQAALWKNLSVIDAFSVGTTPYHLALDIHGKALPAAGLDEAIPLLLTAVDDGRLTLEDITKRLHENPVTIFGLPEQAQTHVEVVVGRTATFTTQSVWSPLTDARISGGVHRVMVHGQTVYLDGQWITPPIGRDVSGSSIVHGRTERTLSITGTRPEIPRPPEPHAVALAQPIAVIGPSQLSFNELRPHPAFHRRHILSVKQFTQKDLYDLFTVAHEMRLQVERNGSLDILKGKVLCTLFYEPSTRTSASFDAAMKRCGGEVIQVNANHSSVSKGETLADTIRTLGCYADGVVIRHPDVGSATTAAKYSPVPVINAGDGIGEHPTQVKISFFPLYVEFI
jgi:carbamoyl-phosphate synthase / aspartate carbamoyltransferase